MQCKLNTINVVEFVSHRENFGAKSSIVIRTTELDGGDMAEIKVHTVDSLSTFGTGFLVGKIVVEGGIANHRIAQIRRTMTMGGVSSVSDLFSRWQEIYPEEG